MKEIRANLMSAFPLFVVIGVLSEVADGFITDGSNYAITVMVAIFLVIGTIGNIITMYVIIKNKHLHTPSNYFIVNLCISDLISALICSPLWCYRRTWGFYEWKWTPGLCKFYWAADFTTNYVTAMHILSFALLRCFAVYWPFKIASVTKRRVLVYIGVLWVIAIVVSIPLFWLMGVVKASERVNQDKGTYWPSCSIYNDEPPSNKTLGYIKTQGCCVESYNTYILVVSSIFFYVPEICIIVLSCGIARALIVRRRWRRQASNIFSVSKTMTEQSNSTPAARNVPDVVSSAQIRDNASEEEERDIPILQYTRNPTAVPVKSLYYRKPNGTFVYRGYQAQNDRAIFFQLSLIVIAFMIGYLPLTIYLVWTTAPKSNGSSDLRDAGEVDYWFGVVSYLLLRLSECMNPVMYNLGSSNIRKETKKLFNRFYVFFSGVSQAQTC